MGGSSTVAGWVAQIAFWVLIVVGWRDLGHVRGIVFVALWLVGRVVAGWFPPWGALWLLPYVALLDVGLVLCIFRGDVRIR